MTNEERANQFKEAWKGISARAHQININNGWWEKDRNPYELIALMHTELAEGTEALRHGCPVSDKIAPHGNLEEEMADVIIRIMDFGAGRNLDIASAVIAKLEVNSKRGYRHGGKEA